MHFIHGLDDDAAKSSMRRVWGPIQEEMGLRKGREDIVKWNRSFLIFIRSSNEFHESDVILKSRNMIPAKSCPLKDNIHLNNVYSLIQHSTIKHNLTYV